MTINLVALMKQASDICDDFSHFEWVNDEYIPMCKVSTPEQVCLIRDNTNCPTSGAFNSNIKAIQRLSIIATKWHKANQQTDQPVQVEPTKKIDVIILKQCKGRKARVDLLSPKERRSYEKFNEKWGTMACDGKTRWDVCNCRTKPKTCPLSDEEYNSLPTISFDKWDEQMRIAHDK